MNLEQIRDRADIGVIKRWIRDLADSEDFDETVADHIEIVVSEGATNLLRHAGGGQILYGLNTTGTEPALEVAFVDGGPGIPRVEKALEDGYSTSGGLGQGLGSIRRLSNEFDIYSQPDVGTTISVRFFRDSGPGVSPNAEDLLSIGGFVCPLEGQDVSGDGWTVWSDSQRTRIILCDGLGHGEGAHHASRQAARSFTVAHDRPLEDTLDVMHKDLAESRGVACLALDIEHDRLPAVTCAGVGNISGHIVSSEKTRQVMSYDGTLGKQLRQVRSLVYDDVDWSTIIMATDGLRTRWKPADYPGLMVHQPLTIAATLWWNLSRGTDDTGIVVIKRKP